MFIAKLAGKSTTPITGRLLFGGFNTECGDPDDPIILVLPNGDPSYYPVAAFAARKQGKLAVILETGGPLCHLAITANESDRLVVMLLPKARETLREGASCTINPNTCSLDLN